MVTFKPTLRTVFFMSELRSMVRLSKLMSEQGLCSRREADAYITKGWVFVNGEQCSTLGTKVPRDAKISLSAEAQKTSSLKATVILNKPIGYTSSPNEDNYPQALDLIQANNQLRNKSPLRFTPEQKKSMAPAGRLDIDSTGLLVLTQDGRIAKQLIGENSLIEKEYLVRVDGKITQEKLNLLCSGLHLDHRALKQAKVTKAGPGRLRFILKEGRKRQIRRMCELVDLKVIALKRIRIGQISLGGLRPGHWRYLLPGENF